MFITHMLITKISLRIQKHVKIKLACKFETVLMDLAFKPTEANEVARPLVDLAMG